MSLVDTILNFYSIKRTGDITLLCHRRHGPVGLLYEEDGRFEYETEDPSREFPAFDINTKVHENAIDVFARRLPPKTGTDYKNLLDVWNLDPEKDHSIFTLLAYGGGKLYGDPFYFIDPLSWVDLTQRHNIWCTRLY